jgi:hypothetical protein
MKAWTWWNNQYEACDGPQHAVERAAELINERHHAVVVVVAEFWPGELHVMAEVHAKRQMRRGNLGSVAYQADCESCQAPLDQHVQGKCPFAPTKYYHPWHRDPPEDL